MMKSETERELAAVLMNTASTLVTGLQGDKKTTEIEKQKEDIDKQQQPPKFKVPISVRFSFCF